MNQLLDEVNKQIIQNANAYDLDTIQWVLVFLIFYFVAITSKYLIFVIWNLLKMILPETDLLKRYSQQSQECWAVVTGATDGIGLGFCQELVTRGFNVCVISKNMDKINKVIEKLQLLRPQNNKNQKIKGVQFDFTQVQDQVKFQKLLSEIEKLDIGLLVNNVGIPLIKTYEDAEYKQIMDVININCLTMACLNNKVIKLMKNRKSKSAIINLSSLSGINPIPYISLYAATKAFNKFISDGLSIQYSSLDIIAIAPMFVVSAGSSVRKGFNIPTARECANHSLKELRYRQYESLGYLSHRLIGQTLLTFLPKWFLRITSKIQMKKIIPLCNIKKQ